MRERERERAHDHPLRLLPTYAEMHYLDPKYRPHSFALHVCVRISERLTLQPKKNQLHDRCIEDCFLSMCVGFIYLVDIYIQCTNHHRHERTQMKTRKCINARRNPEKNERNFFFFHFNEEVCITNNERIVPLTRVKEETNILIVLLMLPLLLSSSSSSFLLCFVVSVFSFTVAENEQMFKKTNFFSNPLLFRYLCVCVYVHKCIMHRNIKRVERSILIHTRAQLV